MITLRPIERPWAKPTRPPLKLALAALIAAVTLTGADVVHQLRARPSQAEPAQVVAPAPSRAAAASVTRPAAPAPPARTLEPRAS